MPLTYWNRHVNIALLRKNDVDKSSDVDETHAHTLY